MELNDEEQLSELRETPEQQPSTEPDTGTNAKPQQPAGFEWGNDAPPLLRGLNAQQTVDLISNLATELHNARQAQQQQPQQYQPQPQQYQQPNKPLSELMYEDPDAYHNQLAAALGQGVQQYMNATIQPLQEQAAGMARQLSRADKKVASAWQRYEGEIDRLVANVPAAQRTKLVYDKAAQMVLAEHLDELAEERAGELAAQRHNEFGESSDSRDALPGSASAWKEFEKSELGRMMLEQHSKRQIAANAEKAGYTLEEYAKLVGGSKAKPSADGTRISGVRHG